MKLFRFYQYLFARNTSIPRSMGRRDKSIHEALDFRPRPTLRAPRVFQETSIIAYRLSAFQPYKHYGFLSLTQKRRVRDFEKFPRGYRASVYRCVTALPREQCWESVDEPAARKLTDFPYQNVRGLYFSRCSRRKFAAKLPQRWATESLSPLIALIIYPHSRFRINRPTKNHTPPLTWIS